MVREDFKYNANTTAVPIEIIQRNFEKIKEGVLHPKRKGQSIRREMTERRISNNIQLYNAAVMQPDSTMLFIGQKKLSEADQPPANDIMSTAGRSSIGLSESR